jgi:flagellar biosynthesis/type III secretory pathway ATPase
VSVSCPLDDATLPAREGIPALSRVVEVLRPRVLGTVSELVGLHLEVRGLRAAAGDLVSVETAGGPLLAEVAALRPGSAICLPLGKTTGVRVGDLVHHTGGPLQIRVGDALRGRVLDGLGRPVDGGPDLAQLDGLELVSTEHAAPDALSRPRINEPLAMGVRALDALVPVGRWPRGARVHRGRPRRRGARALRGGRRHLGRPRGRAAARRVHGHPDRGVVPRRGS